MVGIVFNDSTSAMEAFLKAQGVNYPVLTDSRGLLGNEWGVSSPPTTFIISPSGRVVKALVGPTTASQLDKAVAQFQTPPASSGN
jgi:peroxiredoxin